jgi:8-oxo-dGTP diphosphatase
MESRLSLAYRAEAAHLLGVPLKSIRVVAAVISDGERLLVCQRPMHKRHGGLWEFPGGKCEPGETDAAAVRRELREELGVKVGGVGAAEFSVRDPDSPFEIVFVPVTIVGTLVCHEHTALFWGTAEELETLPLAPSDRRYVESRSLKRGMVDLGEVRLSGSHKNSESD